MLVVLFGSGSATAPEIIRASEGLTSEVGFLIDLGDAQAVRALPALAALGFATEVDPSNEPALVDLCRSLGVTGVVTFVDSLLPVAAKISESFGLPGLSYDVAQRLTSKWLQRTRLNEAGVSPVEVWNLDQTPVESLPSTSWPAILKPDRGTSSRNTYLVSDRQRLREILDLEVPSETMILEEFIPNSSRDRGWLAGYVSVESTIRFGQVQHMGVTDKLPLVAPARESGFVFPSALETRQSAEIEALTVAAIQALGIEHGVTHTEVKLTDDGPVIIEVNGRLGGDIQRLATRTKVTDPVRSAIMIALGIHEASVPAVARSVAMSFSVLPPADVIGLKSFPPAVDLRSLPGVFAFQRFVPDGERMDWREGSVARVADVWIEAPNHHELEVRFNQVSALVAAHVEWMR